MSFVYEAVFILCKAHHMIIYNQVNILKLRKIRLQCTFLLLFFVFIHLCVVMFFVLLFLVCLFAQDPEILTFYGPYFKLEPSCRELVRWLT